VGLYGTIDEKSLDSSCVPYKYTVNKFIPKFYTWVDDADLSTWVTESADYSFLGTLSVYNNCYIDRLICVIFPGVEIYSKLCNSV
jgi:hypothetical protein